MPTVGVLLAVALGVAMPQLDAAIDNRLPADVTAYLFGGGASAARTLLDVIASSLITVTALTFSLTVVTLQLASSQFSPRLLRTFTRDRFVHITLALLLATFTFALTVLRTVRSAADGQVQFVPQLSVTMAFVLALASIVALVLFLAHLVREIRVETMLSNVHAEARETARRVLEKRAAGSAAAVLPSPSAQAVALLAGGSGFLVRVNESALLTAAVEADAVVLIDRHPGSSLIEATPAGAAWPRVGSFDDDTRDRLVQRVSDAISTGLERTAAQDIGFGLRQLTDVAVKALSPGVNDPTTAIHALGHSSALLCELVGYELGPVLLRDGEDQIRVVLNRQGIDELLEQAVAQPRRYGAGDPSVLARLLSLLRELAWTAMPDAQQAVAGQLLRLRATIDKQDYDPTERARLRGLARQVDQAMVGRWVSERD